MFEIFLLYLSIPQRINFLQMGRYSDSGEQRFRRQAEQDFDFFAFNASLSKSFVSTRKAVALDPSFVHKSGKHTPGLGYFWSGCDQRMLKGLEVLSLSVVDADSHLCFHLEAVQTPPVPTLQDKNLTLCDWYAAVIKKRIEEIRSITNYMVADAFFSKKNFVDEILGNELHLISKLRGDADLRYISTKPKTGMKGRPVKYDGRVNPKELDLKYFNPVEGTQGKAYSAIVYCKSLDRNILLIVEEFWCKAKSIYRLLFSTNTSQEPRDVIDIYHARFQIEFGFRDAKQHAGLEHSQARCGKKLYFHINTALTAVNIAKVMQLKDEKRRELPFSMRDYKTLFHNALLLNQFMDMFGINPNLKKNKDRYTKLLSFGTLAA